MAADRRAISRSIDDDDDEADTYDSDQQLSPGQTVEGVRRGGEEAVLVYLILQVGELLVRVDMDREKLPMAPSGVLRGRYDLRAPLHLFLDRALEYWTAFPENPEMLPVLRHVHPSTSDGLVHMFNEDAWVFFYDSVPSGSNDSDNITVPFCRIESAAVASDASSDVPTPSPTWSAFPCSTPAGSIYFAHPSDSPSIRVFTQPILASELS